MKSVPIFFLFFFSFLANSFAQDNRPVIYIPYGLDGPKKIKVIDASTFNEVFSIPFASTPGTCVVISKDSRFAFIPHATFETNGVSVVDLQKQQFVKTIFNDNQITNLRLGPDGLIYSLLTTTQQLAVLNPSTLQVLRTIQLPSRPASIIINSDARTAYVLSTRAKEILAIDLISNSIIRSLTNLPDTLSGEDAMVLSKDSRSLYLALNGNVAVIDLTSFRIVDSLPGSSFSYNLQLSPDGNTLYVADFSPNGFKENLVIVDIPSKQVIKKFDEFGTAARYIKLTPDGRALYISDISRLGGIWVIDTHTNNVIAERPHNEGALPGSIALDGQFDLGTAPSVQVLSPQPGEIIQRGHPFTVRWNTMSGGFNIATHKVEMSIDGGNTFTTIAPNLPAATQEFEFTPTNQNIQSAQIRITSTDISARSTAQLSGTFSIGDRPVGDTVPPTVRFMNPVGGERFTAGDTVMVTWASADNVAVTAQDLALSTDGGATFPMTIAAGLAGSVQSFSFTIPSNLQTPNARLRLAVRDAAGNRTEATTPATFQIAAPPDTQAPTVTISSPAMGQVFPAGQAITVNWRSVDNGAISSQALLLSLDGGATFQTVATFGGNTASFTLNMPELERTAPRAQVKIAATDAAGNRGESTASFSLAPVITMASFTKPTLTISGVGFSSVNPQSQVRVFINGREFPATVNGNTSITVTGNKKKLALVRGSNSVLVVVDGVQSNIGSFQF